MPCPGQHKSAILENWLFDTSLPVATTALALTLSVVFVLTVVAVPAAQAQNFSVIHQFSGGQDGASPDAGLTMDAAGSLYGTASSGGDTGGNCATDQGGCGTVFKLAHKGSGRIFDPLYSFQGGNDGANPFARVIIGSDGSVYGTTRQGGGSGCGGSGCGTVFRLRPPATACKTALCPWTETVLYRFTGGSDGAVPSNGDLVFDKAGNLYGTTLQGGSGSCNGGTCGVVYKLTPSNGEWTESVLYSFTGGSDGGNPNAGVIFDKVGNLYGAATYGGNLACNAPYGCGTIFQLTSSGSGWAENVLYTFQGGSDGANPQGGLIFDPSVNLYGTTPSGGSGGGGTVFVLTPSNGGWTFGVVYGFTGSGNSPGPHDSLIMDVAGNLYGTTYQNGANGQGSVFYLAPFGGGWTAASLHDFTGGSDGGNPAGSVVLDASGNLYSTTFDGGAGQGVVFEIKPSSDFAISASPASLTVPQGNQGTSTVTTTISDGFNSSISLSSSGAPAGTTVSFNPTTIPAPGAGSSTMTVTVASSTPTGTYHITVTGNGEGVQQNATVTLTVTSSAWQQGFDFRVSLGFVTDPPGDNYAPATALYPTMGTLTNYGWSYQAVVDGRDRNSHIDPRLAGINYANNGSPAAFYVDLPSPGTYNVSVAMGDAGYAQCGTQCQVQFLDGANLLASVTGGPTNVAYFYDAQGNNWSAEDWPTKNVSQQVTLAGTQLTVLVGTNQNTGDITPIAFVGVTQVSAGPTFALQVPTSVSVGQGQYSTADVFTVPIGAFNSAISLSATGAPAGATVSFNPITIPAPGAGTSILTISVQNNTPLGNYPVTVTAAGGGIIQMETVVLIVTAAEPPAFTLTAPSAVSTGPMGGQLTGTILTTIADGFNSAISLSSTGAPKGITVSFNPITIPAPGAGSSIMSINVPAGTAFGSYPFTVTAASGQGNQTATVTLTVSTSGQVNLPAGTGWVPLGSGTNFCSVSPGVAYYNPQVGAVDAFDFLGACVGGEMVAYSGGAADTTNDRYFLWTSGHDNYMGNEMYELDLQGASPSVSRVTDPAWTVDNTDVPSDCACKGTNNCGQGMWHDGAGNQVINPYFESENSGPLFESIPAPDGSDNQPSCGYGSKFQPNARETYSGTVYNAPANNLFTWGGEVAARSTGPSFSNWTLDLNQKPAQWTRLKDSSSAWFTAAVYDYTSNHPTSGDDLVFDENQTLYAYNPLTDTYTVLSNTLPDIGYNTNIELDPVHHYLVMENGDDINGYHLNIVDIDSCNGTSCTVTSLDNTASCQAALGYWAGLAWDSKRDVMAIFPSSTNCSGAACTPPFNTAYLLNTDANNPVTITYQGQQQTIQPQQCFAATYANDNLPQSFGPGVYSRFKYYPNEDIYLYIPNPSNPWILRLEQ